MGEFIQKIRDQITEFIKSLDNKRKIALAVASVVLVFVVAGIIFAVTRVQYVTLASDISLEEMSKITTKLDELTISWKDNSGDGIQVPINDLTKAKMALAMDAALGDGDYNWTDVFANSSFTQTSDVKSMMINQAMASTLGNMMEDYIDGVEKAKVSLFIPKEASALLDKKAESRAAVVLKLEEGVKLSSNQVEGIVAILINSVDKLNPERVTIVDQSGVNLNNFEEDDENFDIASQYEQKDMLERKIEKKLNDFLGTVYGGENVRVLAAIELNYDTTNSTTKVFNPPIDGTTEGLVRSMTTIKENVVNAGAASGVPGTESNSEATSYPSDSDSSSNYEKANSTLNYELNETNTYFEKAKGAVENITVSVVLNTKSLVDNILTEEHKVDLQTLISSAVGLDTRVVTVSASEFYESADEYQVFNSDTEDISTGVPIWMIGVILGVILVVVGIIVIVSRRKKTAQEIETARLEEEERIAVEAIDVNREDVTSPKYQIEQFIEAKPESVAQLLRSWMNED